MNIKFAEWYFENLSPEWIFVFERKNGIQSSSKERFKLAGENKRLEERPTNICHAIQWISFSSFKALIEHIADPLPSSSHLFKKHIFTFEFTLQDGAVGANGALVQSHVKAFNSAGDTARIVV